LYLYCSQTFLVYLFIRYSDCWQPPSIINLNYQRTFKNCWW